MLTREEILANIERSRLEKETEVLRLRDRIERKLARENAQKNEQNKLEKKKERARERQAARVVMKFNKIRWKE